MEKSIVLYEKGIKFEKAYVQTLAGEEIVVSKVMIGDKSLRMLSRNGETKREHYMKLNLIELIAREPYKGFLFCPRYLQVPL